LKQKEYWLTITNLTQELQFHRRTYLKDLQRLDFYWAKHEELLLLF
jgi:hypothetical protein